MLSDAGRLAELLPLAMVIALSPLSVIPGILMLHTPRPRPTSLAFLAGWSLGIGAITAAFVAASGLAGSLGEPSPMAPYVRIAIGAGLIGFGLYRWFTRHRGGHTPKWLTAMTAIGPARAFVTGGVLTVANIKVLLMCAAAGLAIATADLGAGAAWTAVGGFTAVAASSVALPALGYLVAGDALDDPLNRLRAWMEANHGGLIAGVLLVLGAGLLYKGVHAL